MPGSRKVDDDDLAPRRESVEDRQPERVVRARPATSSTAFPRPRISQYRSTSPCANVGIVVDRTVERRIGRLSCADRAFLACEQLPDVRAMPPEQQRADRDHRPCRQRVAEYVERAERHQRGGGQGRQRRDLEAERHRRPDDDQREAERPVQREQDARGGGHALAAFEAVKHRKEVADEHGERGGRNRPLRRAQPGRRDCARNTPSQPLTPSPTSVNSAAALLPVRSTLVAPGLPEP